MKKIIFPTLLALIFLNGCASVQMQSAELLKSPNKNKALVNFVRPAVFMGDGISIDIWDSDKFIGSLSAGSLIQYEAEPGKRLFMASAENWSYASADLQAGKEYFIKANIFPGIMSARVALGAVKPDDQRISKLKSLKPTAASEADRNEVSNNKRTEANEAVVNFETGKISSYTKILPGDGF